MKDPWIRRATIHPGRPRTIFVIAALSPAAFVQISEEVTDGQTAEAQMLEVSREEIRKKIPGDVHGITRFLRSIAFLVDQYIYEPLATSLRFLHLVTIFVPVIVTIPMIWFGGRREDRDNERAGTLWWYGFLVASMERAGPTFIKVSDSVQRTQLCQLLTPFRSSDNGQHPEPTSFLQKCAVSCRNSIRMHQPTPST